MKPWRWLLACAGLLLLAGLNLVHGADRVLVPGDPPLTQEVVDLYQQMWEWYCDVKLTPQQRRLHTQHFITFWKKRTRPLRVLSLAAYRDMEKQGDEKGVRFLFGPTNHAIELTKQRGRKGTGPLFFP